MPQIGFYGSSGFVSYGVDLDEGHVIITATIACPFTSDNTATFKADNPKLVSASVGPFSKDGHPLTDQSISEEDFQQHLEWASLIQRQSKTRLGLDDSDQPCEHIYNFGTLKGFAGTFDNAAYNQIQLRNNITHIEQNTKMTTNGKVEGIPFDFVSESTSLWGLQAISHREKDGFDDVYVFDESAGLGVTIFVLDSGIRITHSQLAGRASYGHNLVPSYDDTDKLGHGTHVGGTIIGTQYGIARRANVVSVKIFDDNGGGSTARTMAGLQWVVENTRPMSVVNMSLSGPYSKAYNQALDAAVYCGLTCVVAAGNNASDARNRSPASADSAICAGAVDIMRTRSMLSNYGPALSIFAPGVDIVSCGVRSDDDLDKMTGTSMACAHVSGVAAYLISKESLKSPSAVAARMSELATRGAIINGGEDSPSLFLYNGSGQ